MEHEPQSFGVKALKPVEVKCKSYPIPGFDGAPNHFSMLFPKSVFFVDESVSIVHFATGKEIPPMDIGFAGHCPELKSIFGVDAYGVIYFKSPDTPVGTEFLVRGLGSVRDLGKELSIPDLLRSLSQDLFDIYPPIPEGETP